MSEEIPYEYIFLNMFNNLAKFSDKKSVTKDQAYKYYEKVLEEAKDNASAIVQEALINAQKTEQEYELLKKKCKVYQSKMESLAKAQLELCKDIDDIE